MGNVVYSRFIMGKIFQDIKLAPDVDSLSESSTWSNLFCEGVSTALWIIVANKASGDAYAWGLSYVLVKMMFGGNSSMNSLCNIMSFLKGESDWLSTALNFVFHALGAMGAVHMSAAFGFNADNASASAAFTGENGLWSSTFYNYFFCNNEVIGLFLFAVFKFNSRNQSGMPDNLWSMLLIAMAFFVGGEGFNFFPARFFNKFGAFSDAACWAALVQQVWAVALAAVFMDYLPMIGFE